MSLDALFRKFTFAGQAKLDKLTIKSLVGMMEEAHEEIDAETFLETMRQNTHFNLVDTVRCLYRNGMGRCICFAYCTDSTYFDCEIYPFSPVRFVTSFRHGSEI